MGAMAWSSWRGMTHMLTVFVKFAVATSVILYVAIKILGIAYGTVGPRTGPAEFFIMSKISRIF
jgi:hypothetical protein